MQTAAIELPTFATTRCKSSADIPSRLLRIRIWLGSAKSILLRMGCGLTWRIVSPLIQTNRIRGCFVPMLPYSERQYEDSRPKAACGRRGPCVYRPNSHDRLWRDNGVIGIANQRSPLRGVSPRSIATGIAANTQEPVDRSVVKYSEYLV